MNYKFDKTNAKPISKDPKEVSKITKDLLFGESEKKLVKKIREGKINY